MKKTAIFIASIFIFFSGIFVSPAPLAYAQTVPTSLDVSTNIESAVNKGCETASFLSANCLLYAFYYIALEPSFSLVGLAANILDFFLGYSLDSNAYNAEFITKGWGLIRDISNVAFIFTLLYLAIRHILGMSAKKAIPTLIVVALLLNFSLFFTKVVIDAGNILARAFYSSIVIENDPNYDNVDGYKSITLGLVDKINPQNLLSPQIFSSAGSVIADFDSQNNTLNNAVPNLSDKTGTIFFIFLLMVVVNLILAWTFISVALLFVGRVIGLWFSMIFSPIAFITLAVPGSGGLVKQLSFDSWKDSVLKLAFLAPIFIFFLYLTISFLDAIFGTSVPSLGESFFINLMEIIIPFIFIILLLQIAKKTAESMAGDFGGMVKSVVGKLAGVVAGGALGATAFAGRKVVGGLASSALKEGNYNKRIADARDALKNSTSPMQTALLKKELYSLQSTKNRLTNWKKSSFDIRNADKSTMLGGAVGSAAGFAGKNIVRPGMNSFAGKDFTVGKGSKESRDKFEKDQEKKTLAMAEDQSSVAFREKAEIRKEHSDDIKQEEKDRKVLEDSFNKQNETLQTELEALVNKKGKPTEEEEKRYTQIEKEQKALKEQKEKTLSQIDDRIKEKKKIDPIKHEEAKRKGLVADAVDSRNLWGAMMGVDNKEFADSIRSGKKSKSPEEIIREQMKKIDKDEDKPKDEDKKEPEKPKDEESK